VLWFYQSYSSLIIYFISTPSIGCSVSSCFERRRVIHWVDLFSFQIYEWVNRKIFTSIYQCVGILLFCHISTSPWSYCQDKFVYNYIKIWYDKLQNWSIDLFWIWSNMSIHLATLYIRRWHLRKRKSWIIIGLIWVPLEFQIRVKNWIFSHSTWYLNYTCPYKQCHIVGSTPHETSSQMINMYSIKTRIQSYCDTSYSMGGVDYRWILKILTILKIWYCTKCTCHQGPSFHAIVIKY
jgi:hypothetical protein